MTAVHGFVDESVRSGTYRLTLVRVATADLMVVTRTIRQAIPTGRYRLHLSSEGAAGRRRILRSLVKLPIRAYVMQTPYDGRTDDQVPRDRCLMAVAGLLPELGVTVLVLDTRGHERDRRDRTRLGLDLKTPGRDERITYAHRGSRDEPLIALPDAIGWAIGAPRPWPDLVRSLCDVRTIPEVG